MKITIIAPSIKRYVRFPGWKWVLMKAWDLGKYCATVGGNARIAAAKMIGMTPAMFTRSGR